MVSLKSNTINCAGYATNDAMSKKADEQRTIVEMLIMIQVSINSLAEEEARKLCRVLIESKNPDKMKQNGMNYDYGTNGVRHDAELMLKDLDRYNDKLIKQVKLSSKYKSKHSLNRSDEKLVADMSNAMDVSDEVLGRHLAAIKDYLKRKTPLGTEFCPKDPWMLQQIMLVEILTGLASNVYERSKVLEPAITNGNVFAFTDFQIIHNRAYRIVERIKLRNKYDKPLRFNFNGVLGNKELIGSPDKDGRIDDGILCHLRDTLYSTNFIDLLFIERDGIDSGRRFICDSIIDGLKGDKSIKIGSDEKNLHSVCA